MLSNGDDRGDGAMGAGDGSRLVDVERPVDAYRLECAEKKAIVTSNELRDCRRRGCDFSCSMVQLGDRLVS